MKRKEDSTSAALSKKTSSELSVPSSPPECPTPAETSVMLAKEMNQLTVEEREKVLEDVHGIARVVDEPQEFIEACLALLEKEIENISSKPAYDLASFMSKEYTSSKKIRLMFLRAESFDPYKAASRMVRFFDEKYKLFGADKLTKDITLDDLDPDDITTIENGVFQSLPERDRAGRNIFAVFPKLKVIRTTQNLLRAYYYVLMRSVEDNEEAQKRGVVGCIYCVGGGLNFDLPVVRKTANLRSALPARFDSVHACYNDPLLMPLFSLGMVIMGAHSRMRFRTHYGSDEECQYQLGSFGIPIYAFPVNPRGEFNLEHHRHFVAMQRAIEATKSKGKGPLGVAQRAKKEPKEKVRARQPIVKEDVFVMAVPQPNVIDGLKSFSNFDFLPRPSFANPWWNIVGAPTLPPVVPPQIQPAVVPQSDIIGPTSASRPPAKSWVSPAKPYVIYDPLPNDVLLGRGKPIQERPGNVRFRDMLDRHIDNYAQGKKGAKAKMSTYIVRIVNEEGGRFLKQLEDGGWVEVDEATARAKVSHAFRTRRGAIQASLKKDKGTAA